MDRGYVNKRNRNRSSLTDMVNELGWKSLQERRRETGLAMIYKIVNEKVAINKDKYLEKVTRLSRYIQKHAYILQKAPKDSSFS